MVRIVITLALAFLTALTIALSPNYPFDQLPRPVRPATFTGEINSHAFELNGTVQVSTSTFLVSFTRSND
jgi:hypothetical protein